MASSELLAFSLLWQFSLCEILHLADVKEHRTEVAQRNSVEEKDAMPSNPVKWVSCLRAEAVKYARLTLAENCMYFARGQAADF